MSNLHSPECLNAQEQRNREIAAWTAQWPHHCRACLGRGLFYGSFDPSPGGVALSRGYMEEVDPCRECTEECICPRCGSRDALDEDGNGPCQVCGFNFDDGCPPAWECTCYEDEPFFSRLLEAL